MRFKLLHVYVMYYTVVLVSALKPNHAWKDFKVTWHNQSPQQNYMYCLKPPILTQYYE